MSVPGLPRAKGWLLKYFPEQLEMHVSTVLETKKCQPQQLAPTCGTAVEGQTDVRASWADLAHFIPLMLGYWRTQPKERLRHNNRWYQRLLQCNNKQYLRLRHNINNIHGYSVTINSIYGCDVTKTDNNKQYPRLRHTSTNKWYIIWLWRNNKQYLWLRHNNKWYLQLRHNNKWYLQLRCCDVTKTDIYSSNITINDIHSCGIPTNGMYGCNVTIKNIYGCDITINDICSCDVTINGIYGCNVTIKISMAVM